MAHFRKGDRICFLFLGVNPTKQFGTVQRTTYRNDMRILILWDKGTTPQWESRNVIGKVPNAD